MTWLHQSTLSKALQDDQRFKQGVLILPFCYNTSQSYSNKIMPSPSIENVDLYRNHYNYPSKIEKFLFTSMDSYNISMIKCFTSTVMYFPQPKSPVLQCMLSNYQNQSSSLWNCVNYSPKNYLENREHLREYLYGDCLREVFDQCFQESGQINYLKDNHIIASPIIKGKEALYPKYL